MFDKTIYFENVRGSLFGGSLTQEQVDGQTVMLAVWEYNVMVGGVTIDGSPEDLRWLAYMLATTYHETAQHMWPVTEYGSQSYLESKDYYPFIGRGFVQLTWEDNYRRASDELSLVDNRDLVEHPELALDSLIATRILFKGMVQGWFTGKGLPEYFNATTDDPYNARRVINGTDRAKDIEGYHDAFLAALTEAERLEA
jgi:putative chitinase